MGGSKQQKFVLSLYWKPEIRNQGASRVIILLKFLEENDSLSFPASGGSWSSLGSGSTTPASAFIFTWSLSSVSFCVPFSDPYKEILTGFSTYPKPVWFYLNFLPNCICKQGHVLSFWENMNVWGATIQCATRAKLNWVWNVDPIINC